MQVSKWGNSLAVRLPKTIVDELQLAEGDEVDLRIVDIRSLALTRKLTPEEIQEKLKRFQGMLPDDFKFDRIEANERRRD